MIDMGLQTADDRSADRWADDWNAIPENCEPDLSWQDVHNGRFARIIEETRLARMLELKAKKRSASDEYGDLAGQMKAQMNRDGVVRFHVPGIGTATLLAGKPLHECDNCLAAIGEGKRDPYLKVESA